MPDKTIQVDVPDGMSAEQLQKLVATYVPHKLQQYKTGKAKREAVQALIKKHQLEYDAFLVVAKKKNGVTTS